MDRKEFRKISMAIKTAYPRFSFLGTDEEMEFWYRMLEDIDYRVATNAVMEYVSTGVFPPSIAELRRLCMERLFEKPKSFDAAWGTVVRAIMQHGRTDPQGAYALMDETTREVVKNLGWTSLCISENPEADRANFRMAYEKRVREFETEKLLPAQVANTKKELQQRYIAGIEAKAGGEMPDGEGEAQCPAAGHGEGISGPVQ